MGYIKKYGRVILILGVFLIFYLVMFSLFNYYQILKMNSIMKINYVVIAIVMFIGGLMNGKKVEKKGYLEGLKLGAIVIGVMFIFNLLFYRVFSLSLVVYYILILISSTLGSMIGINLLKK